MGCSAMKVQKIVTTIDENGQMKNRYILLNSIGQFVLPVIKYLKFLDNGEAAENTLKSYCYHLKLYFQFLEQANKQYVDVNLDLLSDFISWLRNPYQSNNVSPLKEQKAKRVESTINTILTCVFSFYDYLERTDYFQNDIVKKATKLTSGNHRKFKSFLHHINKGKPVKVNILKLKEPRRRIKVLRNTQIEDIHNCCNNLRDKLLLSLLYEGGLRITEALTLWIEDFDIGSNSIIVRKSKTRAGEGRRVYVTEQTINLFQDFLIDFHADDIDTNFVFFKLRGANKGQPLDYPTVRSLVLRIQKKTGINFTPHMFRHTYATELLRNGVNVKVIQELLGHEQVQTTMNLYLHPSDEDIRSEYNRAQNSKMFRNTEQGGADLHGE